MYTVQVITFVLIAVSMSLVQCDPPKPNVDEKCLVPPPNDVDPMNCCKIPELLDSKLIETCATKVYGPDSNPSSQNEPPFAPHIRVSVHNSFFLSLSLHVCVCIIANSSARFFARNFLMKQIQFEHFEFGQRMAIKRANLKRTKYHDFIELICFAA